MFACTRISKEIEKDNYESGCHGKRTCVMDERCDIVAETVAELLKKISDRLCLDIDDVFIADDTDSAIGRISYNRLETDDGDKPTRRIEADWRAGKFDLWLADYDMLIEWRDSRPLRIEEFAGVKFHR